MYKIGDFVECIDKDPRHLHPGNLGINSHMIAKWKVPKRITKVVLKSSGDLNYYRLDDGYCYDESWLNSNSLGDRVILKIKQLDTRFAERKLNANPF